MWLAVKISYFLCFWSLCIQGWAARFWSMVTALSHYETNNTVNKKSCNSNYFEELSPEPTSPWRLHRMSFPPLFSLTTQPHLPFSFWGTLLQLDLSEILQPGQQLGQILSTVCLLLDLPHCWHLLRLPSWQCFLPLGQPVRVQLAGNWLVSAFSVFGLNLSGIERSDFLVGAWRVLLELA